MCVSKDVNFLCFVIRGGKVKIQDIELCCVVYDLIFVYYKSRNISIRQTTMKHGILDVFYVVEFGT